MAAERNAKVKPGASVSHESKYLDGVVIYTLLAMWHRLSLRRLAVGNSSPGPLQVVAK
jgi:hypothetical protein